MDHGTHPADIVHNADFFSCCRTMPDTIRPGTQSIDRAVHVLKELVARGTVGWRLLDLAGHCGLDRATTHRILGGLVRARLAEQRADRRYAAGPLVFELGVSMRNHAAFQEACKAPLVRLARSLAGVAIVSLRSEAEFVCIAREGKPLKAMTIEVGTRRPLVTSVSGAAMLVALPRLTSRAIVAANFRELERFDVQRIRSLRTMIRRSEAAGYGISVSHVVPGIGAIGYAIRNAAATPIASVAIVGAADDFAAARIPQIVRELRAAAELLEHEARTHLPHFSLAD
jgi:DNA-binding IclR family transcriptional regulator